MAKGRAVDNEADAYSLEGLILKLKSILWPPDVKSQLIGKDPDGGKDRRQKEKGEAEDEIVR